MIVFTADCDRDLKREEAAASMAPPAGVVAGKKEAGASERRVPLACLLPNESTAEARAAGAGKKMEEATAETNRRKEATAKKKMEEPLTAEKKMEQAVVSESGDGALSSKEEGDSLWKEGEMLKLREELWEAQDLWSEKLSGALDRWLKRKKTTTQQVPAVAGKKRKVVRVIVPESYIDYIKENPGMMRELSDEEMAECPERFRQTYAITKVINVKNRAYRQALLDQHQAFGFAYDEFTDDDEKEVTDKDEVAVVDN